MPHRLPFALIFGIGLLTGTVRLAAVTAEDKPAPAASTPAAEAAYRLTYKFQLGEAVRYETVQKVKFVTQFNGNVETNTNTTETQKVYRIVGVNPDGSADLELVIEWVKMKLDFEGEGLPVEFDSKAPGANTQAKFANVMATVGKPQARLHCAPSGRVLKVKEMALVMPAKGGTHTIQLKDVPVRGDDFGFLTVFPTEPITVGKTWVEKSEILVSGEDPKLKEKVQLQRVYKLDSVTGDQAQISFKTSVLTLVKNSNVAIQLIQRETSGKMVFDMSRGAVITRTVDTDKSVINPAGNNTAMHSASHLLERIIMPSAEISDIPTNSAKQ